MFAAHIRAIWWGASVRPHRRIIIIIICMPFVRDKSDAPLHSHASVCVCRFGLVVFLVFGSCVPIQSAGGGGCTSPVVGIRMRNGPELFEYATAVINRINFALINWCRDQQTYQIHLVSERTAHAPSAPIIYLSFINNKTCGPLTHSLAVTHTLVVDGTISALGII